MTGYVVFECCVCLWQGRPPTEGKSVYMSLHICISFWLLFVKFSCHASQLVGFPFLLLYLRFPVWMGRYLTAVRLLLGCKVFLCIMCWWIGCFPLPLQNSAMKKEDYNIENQKHSCLVLWPELGNILIQHFKYRKNRTE